MKICPICQSTYPDEIESCPRDGAQLAAEFREERECPYCAERILRKARVCKHCGHDVEPLDGTGIATQTPSPAASGGVGEPPTAQPQGGKPTAAANRLVKEKVVMKKTVAFVSLLIVAAMGYVAVGPFITIHQIRVLPHFRCTWSFDLQDWQWQHTGAK